MPRAADRAKAATIGEVARRAQYEVLKAGRETVQRSAPLWRRVTDGDPCGFCAMVASRGPVYTSQDAAEGGGYHSACGCTAEPFEGDWSEWEPTPDERRFIEAYDESYKTGIALRDLSDLIEAKLRDAPAITPEPEFVEKIADMLRSGALTEKQLQAQMASASDLGKANARAALEMVAAEKARDAAARVAQAATKADLPTPAGTVAAKVDFPRDALDYLVPQKGYGWSTATRAKTEAALKSTPEGRQLLKTVDAFQTGGSTAIPRLRTDIEKYLTGNGGDLTPGRRDAIENFLAAVGRSDAGDRTLYRGMTIPGDLDEVMARYKVGDDLDLSAASFSSDKKLADTFTFKGAGQKVRGKTKTPVFVEWVGEGKRALPIEKLARTNLIATEKEWVAAGRFQIAGVKKVKRKGREVLVLTIKQRGVW